MKGAAEAVPASTAPVSLLWCLPSGQTLKAAAVAVSGVAGGELVSCAP